MNFQELRSVENSRFYFGVALNRTKKKAADMRQATMRGTSLQKSRKLELTKLENFENEIANQLMGILKSYPSFDNLSEFYQQLIRTTIDLPYLKKSLAALQWCVRKNKDFLREYKDKIRRTTDIVQINKHRRDFF